jgi:hypothetical protein
MLMFFVLTACLGTASATAPAAQEVTLFSAEVQLANQGVESAEEIVSGEVSITWTEGGYEFGVGRLRDRPPVRLPLGERSAPPAEDPRGCSDLDGLGLAGINALGGRYGAYALGASAASTEVGFDALGRNVMTFRCSRSGNPSANCGLWMQLFDPTDPVRTYLDASGAANLVIWVNRRPGATFTLKMADAAWTRRDDSVPIGSLDSFSVEEAEGDWQRIVVPIATLPNGLARDSLAMLVLEATVSGEAELLLGEVELCRLGGQPMPLRPPPSTEPGDRGTSALWVWNTRQLVDDARARADFLDFVGQRGFDRIFLQLVPEPGRSHNLGFVPFDGPGIGPLVAQLRERGALTYAMDGDPYYADRRNHEGILATVRGLAEHNRSVPPAQRFHGVHYDIEPYLVPGFLAARRDTLLDGFVEIVAGISRIARGANLEFGIALPFWFDGADGYTGEFFMAELEGRRAPVLEHLVRLVDELAVMDYRTSAIGGNGAVALVLDELEAARRAGIGVWVGVETAPLLDADAVSFSGTARRGLPDGTEGRWIVAEPRGGGVVRFWFVPEGGMSRLRDALAGDGAEPATLLTWPAGPSIRIPGDSQTYHRLGAGRMEAEVRLMLTALADHPAFIGMAYHNYETLRELR